MPVPHRGAVEPDRHLKDALPHASLIAFTGTPISFADRNTRAVFGDYIDLYDLSRAVDDGATVPVCVEPRLIKVALSDDVAQEDLDRAADDVTSGLDDTERAQIEKSVAVVNAVYGDPKRIAALADDLLKHWDIRSAVMKPPAPETSSPSRSGATSPRRPRWSNS